MTSVSASVVGLCPPAATRSVISAYSPHLCDRDDHGTLRVGGDTPHDPPVPITDGELAPANELPEKRFAGVRAPFK